MDAALPEKTLSPTSYARSHPEGSLEYTWRENQAPIQLLDPSGKRIANPTLDKLLADIGVAELRELYQQMAVARRIDQEATALQRQGELALWAPFEGQEASQIGSVHALAETDFIFPSYREGAVTFARGIPPEDLLRVWRGNKHGGWNSTDHHIAPVQIVIGAQTLHAAGYAMGVKFDGATDVVITYFGDGATSQGDVHEAMVFATSFQVPLIFFCQNNQWAISEPVNLQAHAPIAARGAGIGMPSYRVDGNDVLAVLALTRLVCAHARSGMGPSLIEAVTYRMGPHTTADDPTRYRERSEVEQWREKDPLARLRLHLGSLGVDLEELDREAKESADRVSATMRSGIIEQADPDPLTLFDHVYAQPHPRIEEQRAEMQAYLASFEGQD